MPFIQIAQTHPFFGSMIKPSGLTETVEFLEFENNETKRRLRIPAEVLTRYDRKGWSREEIFLQHGQFYDEIRGQDKAGKWKRGEPAIRDFSDLVQYTLHLYADPEREEIEKKLGALKKRTAENIVNCFPNEGHRAVLKARYEYDRAEVGEGEWAQAQAAVAELADIPFKRGAYEPTQNEN